MRVQAIRPGRYPFNVIREPGDIFEFDGPCGEDVRLNPDKPGEFIVTPRKHPTWVIPAPATKRGRVPAAAEKKGEADKGSDDTV